MLGLRWLSLILVVVLLLAGLPGPVAWAQQSPQQSPQLEYYSPPGPIEEPGGPAYRVGAGIATAATVPLRAVTCVVGGVVGFAILAVTFGTGYRTAMATVEEGCQSPWILTEDDMRGPSWDETSGGFGGRVSSGY